MKEVCMLDLGFFMFISAVFPRFSLVLDPVGRMGGLGAIFKKGRNTCYQIK